jgi:hypothetical protein
MFFSVSQSIDQRFPNNEYCDGVWINLDNGWHCSGNSFSKGYADNYCSILIDDVINISHSVPRSFPLWYGTDIITNLPTPQAVSQVWADDSITMTRQGHISVVKTHLDLGCYNNLTSLDQALNAVQNYLNDAAYYLKKYNVKNLKLFCSGGVDTLLLYALLTHHDIEFELVTEEHYEYDAFVCANDYALKQFWSYKQIHHWIDPTWLVTGSCGDEYLLRGPTVVAWLTAWHDICFQELLDKNPQAYHYHYFNRYKDLWQQSWTDRKILQKECATRADLNQHILDNLVNDHQYWHLGNTVTWTPLKNINLVKSLLQCDIHDLLPQFLDAGLTKQLISRYDSQLLEFVSDYKNHNSKQYLNDFFHYHDQR